MGASCSRHIKCCPEDEDNLLEKLEKIHDGDVTGTGRNGAIVRFQGSSPFISMYSRKGKNGINQDTMTVWENFMGEKDVFFYGVFNGRGPLGHKVARNVGHGLPFKLSSIIETSQLNGCKENDALVSDGQSCGKNDSGGVNRSSAKDRFSSWEASLIEAFKEADEDLSLGISVIATAAVRQP